MVGNYTKSFGIGRRKMRELREILRGTTLEDLIMMFVLYPVLAAILIFMAVIFQ